MRSPTTGLGLVLTAALACCDLPRDAGDTLAEIRASGVVRVGYSHNPPWVIDDRTDQPAGLEPALIRQWAAELGAEAEWLRGGETSLVEALADRTIHVLVGGHREGSPWTHRAAATQTYCSAADGAHVMLTAPGESALLLALDRFLARAGCDGSGGDAP